MYDLQDIEAKREIDRIGKKLLQNVVELALEDGHSHATITGGMIKQAIQLCASPCRSRPKSAKPCSPGLRLKWRTQSKSSRSRAPD